MLATLAVLVFGRGEGHSSWGAGRETVDAVFDGPSWTGPALLAAAVTAQVERRTAGRVPAVALKAIPLGASRSDVTDALGPRAGHGTMHRRGERLDCLMYANAAAELPEWDDPYALCFRGDRLAYKERP